MNLKLASILTKLESIFEDYSVKRTTNLWLVKALLFLIKKIIFSSKNNQTKKRDIVLAAGS